MISISAGTNVNAYTTSNRSTLNTSNQHQNCTTRQQQSYNSISSGIMTVDPSNLNGITKSNCIQLSDMPVEIFDKIFQYSGYKEASNMRLVSNLTFHYSYITIFKLFIHTFFMITFKSTNGFCFSLVFQVSTQMNQVCKAVLNSTFTKLQTQLMIRFQNIKKVMPRR